MHGKVLGAEINERSQKKKGQRLHGKSCVALNALRAVGRLFLATLSIDHITVPVPGNSILNRWPARPLMIIDLLSEFEPVSTVTEPFAMTSRGIIAMAHPVVATIWLSTATACGSR